MSNLNRHPPKVVISVGLGKSQGTCGASADRTLKVYTKGHPDVEIKYKVGDYLDVVAIEFNIPTGTKWLSIQQEKYLDLVAGRSVSTQVSK